jgi:GNAT superfamily N-acetyltransferase
MDGVDGRHGAVGLDGADGSDGVNGMPSADPAVAPESLDWLHAHHTGSFVRTRLTAATVRTVWRLRESVVVEQSHDRHGNPVDAPVLVALGEAGDVARLLAELRRRLPRRPGFVTVDAHSYTGLPPGWRYAQANRWDSMWTESPPPRVPAEDEVGVIDDDDEVQALLDVANPDSHGRPGDPRVRSWLGTRDDGGLVAVGALATVAHSGVAHLRGVSTHPDRRGRGLGTAVSAALTRRGMETVTPLVTLGVYTSNTTAISIYRRLGFHHDRSFVSGPLQP